MVIDCLCCTAEHARELLGYADSYASAIVLSSKAVYIDDRGRHTNSNDPPRFDGPVREDQAILAPDYSGAFDSRDGYGSNKVAAETTLLESGHQISILRPSRIHGRGAARPLEWFVVKRLLDGRTAIPVAHGGLTGNHPTAAVNLARLARTCADQPGRRVLNAADPGRPAARDVIQAIAAACDRQVEVVGLDLEASAASGWTPWASWPPFFLDTAAADAVGYRPAGTYAQTVAAEVHQLCSLTPDEQTRLNLDPYFSGRFDYAADDHALSRPPR